MAAAALLAATLLLYWPALGNDFVHYDDPDYVVENAHVLGGLQAGNVAWSFTTFHAANWHPLTWLSHMLDVQLFGLRPAGHHATSVVLHAIDAVLLLAVLFALTESLGPSLLAAALFAVHPLNVESVAWVAERKNLLSTLFGLLAIAAYRRYARQPSRGRLGVVAALLALSLLAKPMLVTLPFALLLLDYWPLRRWQPGQPVRPLVVEKLPLLALSALSCAVTVVAQRSGGALVSVEKVPLASRIGHAAIAYATYLGQAVWPQGQSIYYPLPPTVEPARLAIAIAVLAAISAASLYYARRAPYVVVGWLWYLGTLVPVIGLVQVGPQAHADRYAYVPLIGIFVTVAWLADSATSRGVVARRAVATIALGCVVALALVSRLQMGFWKDTVALFQREVATSDQQYAREPKLLNALGLMMLRQDRERALVYFQRAVDIDPAYVNAQVNLGAVRAERGQVGVAIEHFRLALARDPEDVRARGNLGAALLQKGELTAAIAELRRASQSPADTPARRNAEQNLQKALARAGPR